MVHAFELEGTYLALDVDSGAVHLLDRLAWEAVRRYEQMSKDEILSALQGEFGKRAVEEVLGELDELKENGQLFTQEDYAGLEMAFGGTLKALCLHVAHDCNLRCTYCFAGTGEFCGARSLMSAKTGKKALDFLIANSGERTRLEVDFFGGEPLMNFPVVKELVAYGRELEKIHGKEFAFTLTTNGLGLTDEVLAFIDQEIYNVVISLDGRKEVHDLMRPTENGKGSYDLILPKAKALMASRADKSYYVRGTFTANNLDFSRDVLSLSDAGFEQISVEPVVASPDAHYALREEHLPLILTEYEKLAREYIQRRKHGRWFNFFHFHVDLADGPCIRKRLSGCGAGNEYVAITPQGDIYPCHQFVGRDGFAMGNVHEGIFNRKIQADFAKNHVLSKPKCLTCWAKFSCTGGCAANAHAFHGDIGMPYEMECEMEKKRLECALVIYAKEKAMLDNG